MSWMEPNIHKGRGSAISKELAEELGIFDSATGLRRKVQQHIQVEEIDDRIVFVQQDGQRLRGCTRRRTLTLPAGSLMPSAPVPRLTCLAHTHLLTELGF